MLYMHNTCVLHVFMIREYVCILSMCVFYVCITCTECVCVCVYCMCVCYACMCVFYVCILCVYHVYRMCMIVCMLYCMCVCCVCRLCGLHTGWNKFILRDGCASSIDEVCMMCVYVWPGQTRTLDFASKFKISNLEVSQLLNLIHVPPIQ